MLTLSQNTKAYICAEPVDMRWSFDALSGMVKSQLGQNPLSGDLFVFLSKNRDRMKVLMWELDGFSLYYKRLEHGKFSWMQDLDLSKSCAISASHFELLLASVQCKNNSSVRKSLHKKTSLHLV